MADVRKLIEAGRVKRGDLVRVEVNGVAQLYRARRSARKLENLRLCDLQHDPVSDANAAILRAMEGRE